LAQNTSESLSEALILLDPLDDYLQGANRKTIRIDVLALQALVYKGQDNEQAALEKLRESLALAEPGGFIRNFVDMGPSMAALLNRLRQQSVDGNLAAYIDEILSAFPAPDRSRVPAPAPVPALGPIEPMTPREIQVLRLLATDLKPKEIADEMNITVDTVRTYCKRIYSKLDVHSRSAAVYRAQELGLI